MIFNPDRDAVEGKAMRKIGRPIQGIDDPPVR